MNQRKNTGIVIELILTDTAETRAKYHNDKAVIVRN
jgi:hypothetical protein